LAKPVDMWITHKKHELPTYPQANNKYLLFLLKTTEDYFLILLISGLDKGSTSSLYYFQYRGFYGATG
jgi:hypothetical protein